MVIQDLLNMTLYLPNRDAQPFRMDTKRYFLLAGHSHAPVTIYLIMTVGGFGDLDPNQVDAMKNYRKTLTAAQSSIAGLDVDQATRARLEQILSSSIELCNEAISEERLSLERYREFIEPLRPAIHANLRAGAHEQLVQFRAQMNAWKTEFPDEDWSNMRVVVLGFHQPRDRYALRLFFDWLLEEPGYERNVVYAEFQHSIFGKRRQEAMTLGEQLLTEVDFDLVASEVIFDDQNFLQSDVMGPAAADILQGWGPSDWRKPEGN